MRGRGEVGQAGLEMDGGSCRMWEQPPSGAGRKCLDQMRGKMIMKKLRLKGKKQPENPTWRAEER